ncbi:hypothetical protein ACFL3C_04720 [Patescibacteria group bacterium]
MPEESQLTWYVVPSIIAISIFIAAIFIEFVARKHAAIKKLEEVLKSGSFLSPTILSITIGVLLIVSGAYHFLFAPGLALGESAFHVILRYAEIIIGIGLVIGIFRRLMTAGMIALFIAAFFAFPYLKVLDYSIYAGVAAYLFLVHRDALSFSFFFHPIGKKEMLDTQRKYAFPILRFIAGLSLAYAAFHHNILLPEGAVAFVEQKPLLNIMQSIIGMETFSHGLFVFQAGVFGMMFGLLLTFGLLERITSTIIIIGLLLGIGFVGVTFLPVAIPYFAVVYIVFTGNQFEDREKVAKG